MNFLFKNRFIAKKNPPAANKFPCLEEIKTKIKKDFV